MTPSVLALVPVTTAVFYFGLARVVLRRAAGDRGTREFLLYLGLLGAGSVFSAIWRMTQDLGTAEYLLRALEFCLVMTPISFLNFLQAFYPTRWSGRARRVAYAAGAALTILLLWMIWTDPTPSEAQWRAAGVLTIVVATLVLIGYATSRLSDHGDVAGGRRNHCPSCGAALPTVD